MSLSFLRFFFIEFTRIYLSSSHALSSATTNNQIGSNKDEICWMFTISLKLSTELIWTEKQYLLILIEPQLIFSENNLSSFKHSSSREREKADRSNINSETCSDSEYLLEFQSCKRPTSWIMKFLMMNEMPTLTWQDVTKCCEKIRNSN